MHHLVAARHASPWKVLVIVALLGALVLAAVTAGLAGDKQKSQFRQLPVVQSSQELPPELQAPTGPTDQDALGTLRQEPQLP